MITNLAPVIEALLLAAEKPLTVEQLAKVFDEYDGVSNKDIRAALKDLQTSYSDNGFELVEVASGFRFQVRQEHAKWVAKLWEEKPQRYSRALLETLSIIAYQQPITRGEIEAIRGVAVSSNIVRTLIERGWIRGIGYKEVPGRPELFATTKGLVLPSLKMVVVVKMGLVIVMKPRLRLLSKSLVFVTISGGSTTHLEVT
jgi:segregation and condensation protein B